MMEQLFQSFGTQVIAYSYIFHTYQGILLHLRCYPAKEINLKKLNRSHKYNNLKALYYSNFDFTAKDEIFGIQFIIINSLNCETKLEKIPKGSKYILFQFSYGKTLWRCEALCISMNYDMLRGEREVDFTSQ